MNNTQRWQIRESVVVRASHQQAKVVGSRLDEQGLLESVQVQYNDGSVEWVPSSNISKFLVEVEPKNNKKFLSE